MIRRGNEDLMAISRVASSHGIGALPLSHFLMAACLLLVGCTGGAADKSKVASSEKAGSGEAGQEQSASPKQADPNAVLLENVRHSLDLNKLGISTDLPFVISMLNQWHDANVAALGEKANTTVPVPDSVVKKISADQAALLNNPVFTAVDGLYLRDCVTARAIASYAAGNTRSDLVRMLKLFQYTIRLIRLTPNHTGWLPLPPDQKIDLPLTQYDLCLCGSGTMQDRIWLFSSLLRQFGIDSVVIVPETPSGQAQNVRPNVLVGVLLGQQVYLFDPHNGVPIPPPAGTKSSPENPPVATLEQAVAHPEVFRQLDPIPNVAAYPGSGESLRKPGVFVIGTLPLWSAKMKRLQPQFSGKDSLAVYEPLADSDGKPGMLTRIGKAGGKFWNADSLDLWPYPQIQLSLSPRIDSSLQTLLSQMRLPLQAPFPWEYNKEQRRVELLKPKQQLQEARLSHLNGGFESALKLYNDVRIKSKDNPYFKYPPQKDTPPAIIRQVGQEPSFIGQDPAFVIQYAFYRSDDDATFFTGMCQFDEGNYRAASETLRKYLTLFVRQREQLENFFQQNARQRGLQNPDLAMQRQLQQTLTTRFFWVNPARLTLALAEAELGRKKEAALILRAIPITNSQFIGYLELMRQFDPAVAAEVRKELLDQYNDFRAKEQAGNGVVPDNKTSPGTKTPAATTTPPAVKPPEKAPPVPTVPPAKPAGTSAASSTKPAETKPVETKPAEKKPAAENPAEKKPADAPVKRADPKAPATPESPASKTTPTAPTPARKDETSAKSAPPAVSPTSPTPEKPPVKK